VFYYRHNLRFCKPPIGVLAFLAVRGGSGSGACDANDAIIRRLSYRPPAWLIGLVPFTARCVTDRFCHGLCLPRDACPR